jgi:hypothetical protein
MSEVGQTEKPDRPPGRSVLPLEADIVTRHTQVAPVAGLVRFPLVMEVNRSVPAANVSEFIAYANLHLQNP